MTREQAAPAAAKRRDFRALAPYFFILPAAAIMATGLVYPVIQAFYLSFYDWKIGTDFEQ